MSFKRDTKHICVWGLLRNHQCSDVYLDSLNGLLFKTICEETIPFHGPFYTHDC